MKYLNDRSNYGNKLKKLLQTHDGCLERFGFVCVDVVSTCPVGECGCFQSKYSIRISFKCEHMVKC